MKPLEKRKLKRRHLIYYLRIFDSNTNELIGHLIDIHPEGMMLITEDPIKTKAIFHLRMVLPKGIIKREQLKFDAKFKWCKKDVNPDFYDIGFQLLNVPAKKIEIIESLIEDFGFRD